MLANWLATGANMLVPFFLTPFVVHRLGSVAYGVWVLAVSTVSYFNLLDLGLRSAVIRYVSKSVAREEHLDAQKTIEAALWFRLVIAAVVVLASIALAFAFTHIFTVPPEMRASARITVLLCTLGVAVTLVAGVFGGVLSALNRFDLSSGIIILQTILRAVGVVLILRAGHGLEMLALWELIIIVIAAAVTIITAVKLYPHCKIHLKRPEMKLLRTIWSYSFKTFIIMVAVQIVFYTDNVVVGAFLSVAAVSFYSIAGSLAMYSGQVSTSMGSIFIPMASGFDAEGRTDELSRLLLRGTQAALAFMLPIALTLLIRGQTFITIWVGPQFGEISGTILQILLISQFFTIANATAGQIAYGTGKHRSVAIAASIEAVLNLTLSLIFVRKIGMTGVAWGTSISQGLVHLVFWPRYVKREIGVPVGIYLWEGWGKVLLGSVPFCIVSFLVDKHFHVSSLVAYFLQILLTLPVYGLCMAAIFRQETLRLWRRWRTS